MATAAVIMAVATVAVAREVVIMAVATVAVATVVVATAVVIALTLINLLEQKVGKTEVMVILLKTLNMKVVGAGEKEECLVRVILQTSKINNPFLEANSLFSLDIQYLIHFL